MSQQLDGIISAMMIHAGPYLIPLRAIVWVEATAEGGALVHVAGGDTLALLPAEVPAEWELSGRGASPSEGFGNGTTGQRFFESRANAPSKGCLDCHEDGAR